MFQGLKNLGNNLYKKFERGATEKLKQYGLKEKGEFEKQVEEIPEVTRMWTDQGNLEYFIPKGVLYKMLCSYCLPFLYYKQVVLRNRVCFIIIILLLY